MICEKCEHAAKIGPPKSTSLVKQSVYVRLSGNSSFSLPCNGCLPTEGLIVPMLKLCLTDRGQTVTVQALACAFAMPMTMIY